MENQLSIAVCDDNAADRAALCAMLAGILEEIRIPCEIMEYENGQTLLSAIECGTRVHILVLEAQMEDMSGLDIAAALRQQKYELEIILVSANLELALQGYEVQAARFLAKPVCPEKLREALHYCSLGSYRHKDVLIPTERGYQRAALAEITCVEAFERGTRFYLNGTEVISRVKFKEAELRLCRSGFMVAHRSYLVNLSQVRYIRRYELELQDGRIVPIGQARYLEILRKFMDMNAE